jgi:DNA-binding transcriptional LysR family regulator
VRALRLRITLACGDAGQESLRQCGEMLGRQFHVQRTERFRQTIPPPCADQPFPGPFLYYPSRRQVPPALRAFIDFAASWRKREQRRE